MFPQPVLTSRLHTDRGQLHFYQEQEKGAVTITIPHLDYLKRSLILVTFREPFSTIVTGAEVPPTLLPLTLDCAKGAGVRAVAVLGRFPTLLPECAEAAGVRPVAVWEAFPMLLGFLLTAEAEKWVMAL